MQKYVYIYMLVVVMVKVFFMRTGATYTSPGCSLRYHAECRVSLYSRRALLLMHRDSPVSATTFSLSCPSGRLCFYNILPDISTSLTVYLRALHESSLFHQDHLAIKDLIAAA